MMRCLEWRSRLFIWSNAQLGRPFVWGETDCATLARWALEECFGRDVMPAVPRWHSAREALAVIRDHGSPAYLLKQLGAQQATLPFARTGDVLCMPELEESIGRQAMGIWLDGSFLTSSWEEGVHLLPRFAAAMPETEVYSLWEANDSLGGQG